MGPMPSTQLTFRSREEHRAWLETQSRLPLGFRVGTTRFEFTPVEVPKPAWMNITLIAADKFLVKHGLLTGEPTLQAPATGEKLIPAQ